MEVEISDGILAWVGCLVIRWNRAKVFPTCSNFPVMGIKVTIKFIYYWTIALFGKNHPKITKKWCRNSLCHITKFSFCLHKMWWDDQSMQISVYSIKLWSTPISYSASKYCSYIPTIKQCANHKIRQVDVDGQKCACQKDL